jgi:hypothetical protein
MAMAAIFGYLMRPLIASLMRLPHNHPPQSNNNQGMPRQPQVEMLALNKPKMNNEFVDNAGIFI